MKLRHPSLMFNQLAPIQAQGGRGNRRILQDSLIRERSVVQIHLALPLKVQNDRGHPRRTSWRMAAIQHP